MQAVELEITTCHSFLRGASQPEEFIHTAAALGYAAIALTDHASLGALPRAWRAAQDAGIRLLTGVRLTLTDGTPLLLYPADRAAYGALCRLLTQGYAQGDKTEPRLAWEDLDLPAQLYAILLSPAEGSPEELPPDAALARLRTLFAERAFLALTPRLGPREPARLGALATLARRHRLPLIATGDVRAYHPSRAPLLDVLTAIRLGVKMDELGPARPRAGDHHLRSPAERAERLADYPEALANAAALAEALRFDLGELRYQYPEESEGEETPQARLERLVWEGAAERYGGAVPEAVRAQLRHELALIGELGYAPYFLTVWAIVREARRRGILCQGRGSAANSAVCYVLGITAIDPVRSGLLFERFISAARNEPPDIDVDFEHERREEIIQWVFDRYGRRHAALTASLIRYRTRSALRDVGKALGLSPATLDALSRIASPWSSRPLTDEEVRRCGLDPAAPRLRLTLALAGELIGFPRHLSQHPGGFVLSRDPLDTLVPILPARMAGRQTILWDKDDLDLLRFMKVDLLALGMLSCLRRAFALLEAHGRGSYDLARIPPEDPATYAMIQKADTVGVFQIESRAQMAMLPRLRPASFYDLVIEVAIVRPGPIQGEMVHPYLRRRLGREPVSYPSAEIRAVLEKTLGVPLFQEQAMRLAMVAAGFSPEKADALRRAMATFRHPGTIARFRDELIEGMRRRGYDRAFAECLFRQIEGFGSYGFPESHAASFALLAYASAWIKCHHPDVFACALLNAQPLGFYAPAQILRDARRHGVEVRPVSVLHSDWDCTLEKAPGSRWLALRLGLRFVKDLPRAEAEALIAARRARPFTSLAELRRRVPLSARALTALAAADALAPLGHDRRNALWATAASADAAELPLFAAASALGPPETEKEGVESGRLAPFAPPREVQADYQRLGFSLRAHPLAFLRPQLTRAGFLPCAALTNLPHGQRVRLAGLVILRQRPGSAHGVTFFTLEDETGEANLILWPRFFERHRPLLLSTQLLAIQGRLERNENPDGTPTGPVLHVIVETCHPLHPHTTPLPTIPSRDFR